MRLIPKMCSLMMPLTEARLTWQLGKEPGLLSSEANDNLIENMLEMEQGILSMNMRGLGSTLKKKEVRELIQESKLEVVDGSICRSLWGNGRMEWSFKEANRRIISIWNSEVFSCSSSWHMSGGLTVNGYWGNDRIPCCIININAPCSIPEKLELWDRITSIINQNSNRKIALLVP
ncbi:hypothetical protein ACS0TY_027493 [Phlomoides rotata]